MVTIYDEMNEKTKDKIQQCFLQLLKEKPFMKITIRDITTLAAITEELFTYIMRTSMIFSTKSKTTY